MIIPLLFSIPSDNGIVNSAYDNFPVPPKSDNLLFFLQRTVNTNTVVYEINKDKNGEINLEEPIKIQWIRYAKDSAYESLNYIQKNYAYGIDIKLIDTDKKSFVFNFVSYKEKPLYLLKSAFDNKYHVYIHINKKLSILEKVFVQIVGGTFWLPQISYVEITGNAPATAEKLIEKIKP